MVLFNDPQRYVAPEVYTLLKNNDIIPQLFRHVQVPPGQTREYQFTLATHNIAAYIQEIWGHKPENVAFADAKARSYIVQKDAQLHREQWINLAGPRGTRKQQIASLFGYSILQGLEAMVFMGAGAGVMPGGYQNGFFNLVSDATSSIHKPADTCSTGGTADTGSSYTGGARTSIALHTDLSKAFLELKAEGFIARQNGLVGSAKTKHVFLNQLAYEMIYTMPMYNGASYGDSYKKVLDDNQVTPVVADIIDADYAGADDGTTQLVTVPDIQDNFIIGVINSPRQEPWQEALAQHGFEMWSKFWGEFVQFAIPKDNGTYYKKAVHVLNIIPYNST